MHSHECKTREQDGCLQLCSLAHARPGHTRDKSHRSTSVAAWRRAWRPGAGGPGACLYTRSMASRSVHDCYTTNMT